MRVLFDLEALQPVNSNLYDGGAEYAKVVFLKLLTRLEKGKELLVCYNPKKMLGEDVTKCIAQYNLIKISKKNNEAVIEIVSNYSIDVFYSAIPYNYNFKKLSNIKSIITVHGLRALELPTDKYEYKYASTNLELIKATVKKIFLIYYKGLLFRRYKSLEAISSNTRIITVSNHSKYSLLSFFPNLKSSNITVLYSPLKKNVPAKKPGLLNKLDIKSKGYYLMISGNRWTKNIYRAIKSFDWLYDNIKSFDRKVVILGVTNTKIHNFPKNKGNFVFLGYQEPEHLEYFYKEAYSFIFPSLNEGFGYPPLESMKYGVPVIASAVTSIPEVCQNAALYYNPYSYKELINRILQIELNLEIYNEKVILSKNLYKKMESRQKKDLNTLINIIYNYTK